MSLPLALPPMADVLRLLDVDLVGDHEQQIRCPVHADRSPSARFYAEDQRIYCFVCRRGWDALGVVMGTLKLNAPQAMDWLRARFAATTITTASAVRTQIAREAPISLMQLEATFDLLDALIPQQTRDPATAVLWWTALDYLREAAREGEDVGRHLAQLRKLVIGGA